MSTKEKFPRITITLPPDLLCWVKEKEASLNAKDRRMKTSVSAIIADAVDEMKKREELSQAMPDMPRYRLNEDPPTPQDTLIRPSTETLDGGLSTATTARYQKGGRRKS
ncbi:MAG: hypothetical protein WCG66_03925 [bacterium]|jgi:hypothetical protein